MKSVKSLLGLMAVCLLLSATFLSCPGESGPATIRYTRWAGTQEAIDFQKLVDTYTAKHPNITIETEFLPWGAYWEKVRNSVLSGEAADLISLSQIEAGPYIGKGVFYKLDDLPGAKELLDQMQPGTKFVVMYGGNIYAMPIGVGVRAMIYNKKLLQAAGIPLLDNTKPITWEEWYKIADKLIKKENGKVVQYPAHWHKMEMYEAFIVQCGGKLLDDYTKPTKVLVNSPEGIAGLRMMVDQIKKDYIPPHTGDWAGPWGTPDSAVATGKVVFMQAGPWGIGPLVEAGIDYATAPLPYQKVRANRGYVNSIAIAKNSANVNAAWDFIRWVCGPEGQLEFTKTGDLPANKLAVEKAKAGNTQYPPEIMAAFFSDLESVITGPMLPSGEFGSLLDDVLTQLFQLKITPEEAAARLEKDGNEIIKAMFQ